MATTKETYKQLGLFEQQQLFNSYLDQAKDLLDDAIGSAEIESWAEANSCIEDFEACLTQARTLKELILSVIKTTKK
jgi:hypothetical protein